MSNVLIHIKKRPDFLQVARCGDKVVKSGFVLQVYCREKPSLEKPSPAIRIGFTASKKVGNAVCRNRAKRRLRALCARTIPIKGELGHDYVFIARRGALERPFNRLYKDLKEALREIKKDVSVS